MKTFRYTASDVVFQAVDIFLLTCFTAVCIYPIIYVTSMSISDSVQIALKPAYFLPRGFSLNAMALLLGKPEIWRYYGNTILYTVAGTSLNLFLTVLLAYPMAVRSFGGRKIVTALVVFTMLFSGGMIPSYILVNKLHMYNTRLALIIPGAVSAFNTIIARTFFSSLPTSLSESAKIDGATDIRILFQVILPVSKAILATLLIYYAVGHWNSYFSALLYLPDSTKHPLQMFLVKVLVNNDPTLLAGQEVGIDRVFLGDQLKYCCIVVSSLPILCVYPFFQKHFTKGAMMGSLKG